MDLPTAICDAGVEAVLKACEISGPEEENEIREEFLSALMAVNLHRALAKPVRVEVPYTIIYGECVGTIPLDTEKKIGGYRADIALYEQKGSLIRPTAIVEVKKYDEGAQPINILTDLDKGDLVDLGKYLPIYAGIFICETTGRGLEERKNDLQRPGYQLVFSCPQVTRKGWKWCFGCLQKSGDQKTPN